MISLSHLKKIRVLKILSTPLRGRLLLVKPTVVIAYTGFENIDLETNILRQIDAEIIHSGNLTSPEALEAVKEADAIIVTLQRVTTDIINSMKRCRIISRAGTGLAPVARGQPPPDGGGALQRPPLSPP